MKLKEVYTNYKMEYNEYILIFKVGNFYTVYENDCTIINLLTGYKINVINESQRLGFPISSFEKTLKKIEYQKINYLVLEKIEQNYEIVLKKKYRPNNYQQCNIKSDIESKINKELANLKIKILNKTNQNNYKEIIEKVKNVI